MGRKLATLLTQDTSLHGGHNMGLHSEWVLSLGTQDHVEMPCLHRRAALSGEIPTHGEAAQLASAVHAALSGFCLLQTEMGGAPDTAAILDALNPTRTTARARQDLTERKIREEARLLGGKAGPSGALSAHLGSLAGL